MDELYPSPPVLDPGTVVADKYVLGHVLGFGGSAVVYEALQLGLRRSVALKVYPIREGTCPSFVERFRREAWLMARICHENVLAVFDNGLLDDGSPYLVVQRVRGESLAQRLQSGVLSIDEVIDLALQLLRALCAIHQVGITHRDIKPDNLMFDRRAQRPPLLKLVDFGVALPGDRVEEHPLDQPGELVGTPRYMSPEQMRGELVDVRSDLYSLGATCYEALTGRTPHGGQSFDEISAATLYEPIPAIRTLREDCPERLERILLKALARDRERRYQTPTEMLKELERWLMDTPSQRVACVEATRNRFGTLQALELAEFDDVLVLSPRSARSAPLSRRRWRASARVALATVGCLAAIAGLLATTQRPSSNDPSGIFQGVQKAFTAPWPSRSQDLLQILCPSFLCPGETDATLSTALDS